MKKVSIIIPAYNAEKTVNRCLDSLFAQDYNNIEIIFLNDGSKDNTGQLVKQYTDERLIYIEKENTGIGDTRNKGIERSNGEYIMFVDSDDYLESNCVSKLVATIEKDMSDLVIFDYFLETDKPIEIHLANNGVTSLKENPNLITNINLAPWNKLYKNTLFKNNENSFAVGLKFEDAPVVLKALKDAKKISFVPECLLHYVMGKNGETLTRDEKIFDIFKICNIIKNIFTECDYIDYTNLIVKILSYYMKNSRYIKDKQLRNRFIDSTFNYLNSLDSNWRRSPYLKEMDFKKRVALKSKFILKTIGNVENLKYKK